MMDGGIPAGWIHGAFSPRFTDSTVSGARQFKDRERACGLIGEEIEQGSPMTLQLRRSCADRSSANIRKETQRVSTLGSLPTTGALAFLVERA